MRVPRIRLPEAPGSEPARFVHRKLLLPFEHLTGVAGGRLSSTDYSSILEDLDQTNGLAADELHVDFDLAGRVDVQPVSGKLAVDLHPQ
jgi:hypothetical protein